MINYKLKVDDKDLLATELIVFVMESDREGGITIQEMDASKMISNKVKDIPEGKFIDLNEIEWTFILESIIPIRFKRSEDSLIDFCKQMKEIIISKRK